LIRKVKNLNIYESLLFNKLEPASGSKGGGGHMGFGPAPPLRACRENHLFYEGREGLEGRIDIPGNLEKSFLSNRKKILKCL